MQNKTSFRLATVNAGRTFVYTGLPEFRSLAAARAYHVRLPGKAAGDIVLEDVDTGWGIRRTSHPVT